MTIKDKLAMFFNRLLDEVESIDNPAIREKALFGLLQQVEGHLTEVSYMLKQLNHIDVKETCNGTTKETV